MKLKAVTNLDSVLESRDITLPTKVHLVKAMFFPVVMYGCESWIMEKAREFQKNIYFCFIDYAKAFDYVDHNKLWNILQEMGIPDHLTGLLRNLYAGQEATVRTGHGKTDWFQIGKEYVKAVYCDPAYLTSLQSTSCEMPGWMKHKLQSRLLLPGRLQDTLVFEIIILTPTLPSDEAVLTA